MQRDSPLPSAVSAAVWKQYLANPSSSLTDRISRDNGRFASLVFEGVPVEMRLALWMSFTGADRARQHHGPGYYGELVRLSSASLCTSATAATSPSSSPVSVSSSALSDTTAASSLSSSSSSPATALSPVALEIQRDLSRTLPRHSFSQSALSRILNAFALYDAGVGKDN